MARFKSTYLMIFNFTSGVIIHILKGDKTTFHYLLCLRLFWITYVDFVARSRYPKQGWVITSQSKLRDMITYPCLRYLFLAIKSSYMPMCHSNVTLLNFRLTNYAHNARIPVFCAAFLVVVDLLIAFRVTSLSLKRIMLLPNLEYGQCIKRISKL